MPVTKMMIKKCSKKDPPHPCDPPLPCDICDEEDAECPDPLLCREKLHNPQNPWETKCKPPPFVGVMPCKKPEPPHPCDPPPPCVPGKPPPEACPDPALCFQRIKNPEPNFIICPDDDCMKYDAELCEGGKVIEDLKIPVPECIRDRCAPPPQLDPFTTEVPPPPPPPPTRRDTSDYSRILCDNLDDLRKSIVECFAPRCGPPIQIDPFKYEEQMVKIRAGLEEEGDPCEETKKTRKT